MRAACLCCLLLAALAAGAAAQFDQFEWTLSNPDQISAGMTADQMWFSGSHSDPPGSLVAFTTIAPVAGQVSVHANFWIEELACGSSLAEFFIGTGVHVISNCHYDDPLVFGVGDLQSFGFGLQINNPLWSSDLLLTSFSFTPYWTVLGGGLAGSAGTPALSGHGILQPGKPFGVQLAGAKPGAPLTLVVGFAELDLPFKGGVMVPTIDRVLGGLATDAAGKLSLQGPWPDGIPTGFDVVLQAWIKDAAGPQGYAASNGLKGSTL